METLYYFFLILLVFSLTYQLVSAVCAVLFRIKKPPAVPGGRLPKVSCLKPLCGLDSGIKKNLEHLLIQDYTPYEVIFGTASAQDPVCETALSVFKENMSAGLKIVSGEKGTGHNRKVRNLRNIADAVSPDAEILVISDSDVRVTGDYLKQITAPFLADPDISAVTCLYRIDKAKGAGGNLKAFYVESQFAPGVFVSSAFAPVSYAFGATIAVRRSDFEQAGGFEAVEDHIADDYTIAKILYARGKKIFLSNYVVSVISGRRSFAQSWSHLVRWNRTVKVCRPVGYFFSVVCHTTPFALLAALFSGSVQTASLILVISCAIRIFAALVCALSLQSRSGLIRAFFSPVWDIAGFFLWMHGLVGRVVKWRDRRYRLFPSGRMEDV